jgi:chemotaxis response regulator CheB
MINYSAIAAAHGIETQILEARVAAQGWEFDRLNATDAAAVDFCTSVVTGIARELAAHAAKIEARTVAAAAQRLACQTVAARANPDRACTKCDGKGTIRGFGHIDGGRCFRCGGKGVR